jgi:cytochrome c553
MKRPAWLILWPVLAGALCAAAQAPPVLPSARPVTTASATAPVPEWAYPWAPNYRYPPEDNAPRRVPGSTATFAANLMSDPFFTPDWHPQDHAPMPEVVFRGRKPAVRACGACHRAEGTGAPENAGLAGLPAEYIVQQMADFKSGARQSAGALRPTLRNMIAGAKAISAEEVRVAAQYFSALKPKQPVRVVEADEIPKVLIAGMTYARDPSGGCEPLGNRIIELADDPQRVEDNDSRATFTAYAPTGSIERGEVLARTGGNGRTVPCAPCHGEALRGQAAIPGIAGRSPSYLARQLIDFKRGTRAGPQAALMAPTVVNLTDDDVVALVAYVSSLVP